MQKKPCGRKAKTMIFSCYRPLLLPCSNAHNETVVHEQFLTQIATG